MIPPARLSAPQWSPTSIPAGSGGSDGIPVFAISPLAACASVSRLGCVTHGPAAPHELPCAYTSRGIETMQLLAAETEAIEHAGPVVREQNVVARGHPACDFDPAGFLQVQRDAAFAAIHRDEVVRDLRVLHVRPADQRRQHEAAQIAGLAILHLHDLGAQVGEKQARERSLNLLTRFRSP